MAMQSGPWRKAPNAAALPPVKVGVPEHDQRIVTAQLKVSTFEIAGGGLADLSAGLGGTCERDDSHLAVGDQRLPDVGATGRTWTALLAAASSRPGRTARRR